MIYLRRFGSFLFDFLIGDAWELFIGPIAAVVVAAVLLQAGVSAAVVGTLLFVAVVAIASLHVALALRSSV